VGNDWCLLVKNAAKYALSFSGKFIFLTDVVFMPHPGTVYSLHEIIRN